MVDGLNGHNGPGALNQDTACVERRLGLEPAPTHPLRMAATSVVVLLPKRETVQHLRKDVRVSGCCRDGV